MKSTAIITPSTCTHPPHDEFLDRVGTKVLKNGFNNGDNIAEVYKVLVQI